MIMTIATKIAGLAATAVVALSALTTANAGEAGNEPDGKLIIVEDDWRPLFDGKTLSGWRSYKKPKPTSAWSIKDGRIVLERFNWWFPTVHRRGALMTVDQFTNFELELEWKVAKRGNSGLMFGVRELEKARFAHDSGIEVQILDNERGLGHKDPYQRAGGIYGLFPPKTDSAKPAGEFNKVRLRVLDGKVHHWLNGVEMTSFDMRSEAWKDLMAEKDYAFERSETGHIVLQDHLYNVEFKNIRIRELAVSAD